MLAMLLGGIEPDAARAAVNAVALVNLEAAHALYHAMAERIRNYCSAYGEGLPWSGGQAPGDEAQACRRRLAERASQPASSESSTGRRVTRGPGLQ